VLGEDGAESVVLNETDWDVTPDQENPMEPPGFDEALLDLKTGDEKEFELSWPAEGQSIYAGKQARFQVKVNHIQAYEKAELTDEFAQTIGPDFNTLVDLKESIRDTLRERAKGQAENAYLEKDRSPSNSYVEEYISNFLEGDPIPGITYEYELFKAYLPGIGLDEVNTLARHWLAPDNRVVLVGVPDKAGLTKPTEEELARVFVDLQNIQYNPYEDTSKNEPLLAALPEAGKIVKETVYAQTGFTHWVLSNGVQVWIKPTDFKNNEIVFQAFSPGGTSLVNDKDFIPAITAASIVRDSGLGNFTKVELDKKLAGTKISLDTYIDDLFEGMNGSTVPKDLETLFQLIYLRFKPPKKNEEAYQAYYDRLRARFVNRASDPENVFWDTLHSIMGQDHIRYRPITPEVLNQMSLATSLAIYQDRFADASDFTFIFVGAFDLPAIKKYVLTYLANLPSLKRQEHWSDLKIEPPAGVVKKTISFGKSPDSRSEFVFHGKFKYSERDDYYLQAVAEILQTRLREKIREEEGGTYSVGVFPLIQKQPTAAYQIYIGFSCDPKRVDELNQTVLQEIEWLKTGLLDESYLIKFKEMQKRAFEKNERENSFWLDQLATSLRREEDPARILSEKEWLAKLTTADIQATARAYLDSRQYVQLVLYPEIDSAIKN
jgi:zinc protease